MEPGATARVARPLETASSTDASKHLAVFYNLAQEIMAYLPLIDVVHFGNTNKTLRTCVPSYMSRAFHELLKRYFRDPVAFRDVMRDTGAVLSGSTVLAFIVRDTHWKPVDLDIYVPRDGPADRLRQHIESVQGFRLTRARGWQKNGMEYEDACLDLEAVHKYESPANCGSGSEAEADSKICLDVLESSKSSPITPITLFHSTLVMNYITADAVVLLYPALTRSRMGIIRPGSKARQDWFHKYQARGFDMVEYYDQCGCYCLRCKRTTQDGATLRITFGDSTVHWTESTSWKFGIKKQYQQCQNKACPYKNVDYFEYRSCSCCVHHDGYDGYYEH